MALDMFLKMGDKIKGEVKVEGFVDHFSILAWSWGASQSGTTHLSSGSGAGKANVQDLSITKYVDASSGSILKCCVAGEHIPEVKLTMRKAGGIDSKQVKFLEITLTDTIITSYSTGGSGGEDLLTENISINFAKVTFTPFAQSDKGVATAGGICTYDIRLQKLA